MCMHENEKVLLCTLYSVHSNVAYVFVYRTRGRCANFAFSIYIFTYWSNENDLLLNEVPLQC